MSGDGTRPCSAQLLDGGQLQRVHGGVAFSEDTETNARASRSVEASPDARLTAGPLVDQSTCLDAFGVHAPVDRALARVHELKTYRHYPDPEARRARRHLSDVLGLPSECLDVAPGAAESIWTLARATLGPGSSAVVWEPCFSEFAHAARAVGAQLVSHRRGSGDMSHELFRLAGQIAQVRPRAVYLCAPSCPRGEWVPAEGLAALVSQFPDTWFVIDQSYLNLSLHAEELRFCFPPNAVLVRSLTKELSLPGVRVGYAVMRRELRALLQTQRPYWNLGAHALAVLEVYGDCLPLIAERRALLLASARRLAAALTELGASPEPMDTHYFTVAHRGRSPLTAAQVRQFLADEGVAVRDCASFGLPAHVRLVAHPDQHLLVQAWRRLEASPLAKGGTA